MSKEFMNPLLIVIGLLLAAFVLIMVTNERNDNRADIPDSGICLEFPADYQLVAVTQAGLSQTVLPIKYFCLNLKTGQYLQCVPNEVICK